MTDDIYCLYIGDRRLAGLYTYVCESTIGSSKDTGGATRHRRSAFPLHKNIIDKFNQAKQELMRRITV